MSNSDIQDLPDEMKVNAIRHAIIHRYCVAQILPLHMTMYTVTYITQNVRSKKTVWEEKLNSSATAGASRLARNRSLLNIQQRCWRFADSDARARDRVACRKATNG
jgi:hypothetical protein